MKYIVHQALQFKTLLQSANLILIFHLLQETAHHTHHNARREASKYECVVVGTNLPDTAKDKWRCCVTDLSHHHCRIRLLRNRNFREHLLPIRSWFAYLTFVMPFHLITSYVQDRKKIMLHLLSPTVSHISTVSDTILAGIQFPPYPSCAMLFGTVSRLPFAPFFFTYFDNLSLNTFVTRPAICVRNGL